MGHERPVPVEKQFASIWQWLLQRGGRLPLVSTGGQEFTAVARRAKKGDRTGEKVIVIEDVATGRRDASIYECCWGWGKATGAPGLVNMCSLLIKLTPNSPGVARLRAPALINRSGRRGGARADRIHSIMSGCARPRTEARGIVRSPRPRFLAALGMTYRPLCHSEESFRGRATRNLAGWSRSALPYGRPGGVV